MPSPPRTRRRFPQPARKLRIESGETSGIWAISYSDLLMVLLAFFILYFKYGEQESASILHSIVRDLDSASPTQQAAGGTGGKSTVAGKGAGEGKGGAGRLKSTLEDLGFKVESEALHGALIIHFSDGFFEPGQYQLNKKNRKQLGKLLGVLSPHKEMLELTFIGHADSTAIRKKGSVIDSNLVLSNLRAARATEFALFRGFDPRYVSSEGVGQYRREARSLSVKVIERK